MRDSLRDFIGMPNTGQLFTTIGWHSKRGLRKEQLLKKTAYKNADKNVPVNTR